MKTKVTLEKARHSFSGYRIKQITGAVTVYLMNPEAPRSVDMIKELSVHSCLTEQEAKKLAEDPKYLVTVR